jgi:pimeloyl-ACP methyl ester carboxylesterase
MLIDRKARPRCRQSIRRRSARLSSTLILTLGLAAAGSGVTAQAAATAATASISCHNAHIPVSLTAGAPKTYSIFGVMCAPASGHTSTVQVLVPGGTYDHIYWDLPYENGRYSYLRYAAEHGYTALAIDPIGTGQSSHPLSALLSLDVNAFTVHEIVQDLRASGLGSSPYAKVMLVGHSYGSFTNWVEAATYKDVNADLDTGALHGINPVGAAEIATNLSEPAYLDPSGRFHGYDPAYLTTWPNTRASFFYNAANADPKVIALDEATKATFAATELATFPLPIAEGTTANINVPVLVVAGQKDAIFCGLTADNCSTSATLLRSEAPYFAPAACLRSYVLPDSGHDVDLQLNSVDFYQVAIAWSNQVVGTGSSPAPGCAGLSS